MSHLSHALHPAKVCIDYLILPCIGLKSYLINLHLLHQLCSVSTRSMAVCNLFRKLVVLKISIPCTACACKRLSAACNAQADMSHPKDQLVLVRHACLLCSLC